MGDFLLDSVSALDTTRLFYTRKIVVAIPAFSHRFSNNPYKGSFEKLVLNTEEKSVVLTKGRYEPTVTPAAYYRMKGENKALTYLRVDSLRLDDFDFHRLLDERALVSKKVLLRKGYAKFYGDKRFPKKPENQIGQAPHQKNYEITGEAYLGYGRRAAYGCGIYRDGRSLSARGNNRFY